MEADGISDQSCAVCSEEFELKPDKPGFANRCPCSEPETPAGNQQGMDADERKSEGSQRSARQAMRNLLYRKDS